MPSKKYRRNPKAGTPLSPRERQVAQLVADDLSNKQIADALSVTPHTAKYFVRMFVLKMGAKTRTGAAVKYVLREVRARDRAQDKWFAEQQSIRYAA